MKTSIYVATLACIALASVPVSFADQEQREDSEPVRAPKFVEGFRQAWHDDKPIGAFAFALGKAVDAPKRAIEWIGGAGLAAKRAAQKAVGHEPKPHQHHHHHHHEKKPAAPKKKEAGEDHKERSKLGQKFHDWKLKVIQWFKDQGCNAKDGWYLARHPEVDISFCDKDADTNPAPPSPPKCDRRSCPVPPKRPAPPKPQPPKGCNVRTGKCHYRSHHHREDADEE